MMYAILLCSKCPRLYLLPSVTICHHVLPFPILRSSWEPNNLRSWKSGLLYNCLPRLLQATAMPTYVNSYCNHFMCVVFGEWLMTCSTTGCKKAQHRVQIKSKQQIMNEMDQSRKTVQMEELIHIVSNEAYQYQSDIKFTSSTLMKVVSFSRGCSLHL